MPSWNVHFAHAEGLLADGEAFRCKVKNANHFLFGNIIPDIYVGFMVPGLPRRIDYKLTHLSERARIPLPSYEMFWRYYVQERGEVSDLVLGAWMHVICDFVYNSHTRDFLASLGRAADDSARIDKQYDFDLYGKSLKLTRILACDEELVSLAGSFLPYSIAEPDLRAAIEVANTIIAPNLKAPLQSPAYRFLTEDFFKAASREADAIMRECLQRYLNQSNDPPFFR